MSTLPEPEVRALLDLCAYTLSDTIGDPGAPQAAQWAEDDARWLWEAPGGLTSAMPLLAVRYALDDPYGAPRSLT